MSEYIGDIREAMPDAWALGRPSRTLATSTVFLELIQMHTLPSSRLRQTQSLNKQDISVLFCYVLFPSVRSVLFCSVLFYYILLHMNMRSLIASMNMRSLIASTGTC